MMSKRRCGFSLVELLVCVAIVSILMAMYMPALSKARRKADGVVVQAGMRDEYTSRMASTVNTAAPAASLPTSRETYRRVFRQEHALGDKTVLATEMLCEVENESQFQAYWNTVIDPDAEGDLEFRNGALVAYDDEDVEYLLPKLDLGGRSGPAVPMAWEFLAVNPADTTLNSLGTNVMFSDGRVQYIPYPGDYPACPMVAELSSRFLAGAQ